MAKDEKPSDLMGYAALQQQAMLGVVRAALTRAASPPGLPGQHHFYISFGTGLPGVDLPDELRTRYPDEMTIVLQNQFWDLSPGDSGFSVTLQFSGQPKTLTIPYSAITRFFDPSVQYLIQFTSPAPSPGAAASKIAPPARRSLPADEGPKIVSLEQFRKK